MYISHHVAYLLKYEDVESSAFNCTNSFVHTKSISLLLSIAFLVAPSSPVKIFIDSEFEHECDYDCLVFRV